jgi:hypothetical protein
MPQNRRDSNQIDSLFDQSSCEIVPQIMKAEIDPSPLSDLGDGPPEEVFPVPVRDVIDILAPL